MTLQDILNGLTINNGEPLRIMYRTNYNHTDEDCLFGYCTVIKNNNNFCFYNSDTDSYALNDKITKYIYKPSYYKGLVVWVDN